jgi:ferredoxin-NADP reductase
MNARVPDPAFAAAPDWQADDDGALTCVQVRDETHDVKTFMLQAPAPRSFRYLPGQFVTLELDIGGERVNRCYTLSSSPTRPDRVSITVKRVPGGRVSNWLHDTLRVGSRLAARGPAGSFSCFAQPPAERLLLLSGGSGVTPMISMTRALHDLASDADIVFVHCARTPADVLFAEELALLAKNLPRFRLALVCEQRGAQPAYAGFVGRIDGALLAHIAPDFLSRPIYTCGPAPFMAGVRGLLGAAGYDMRGYREESFSFEAAQADEVPVLSGAQFVVTLQRLGRSFRCGSDERLLAAAQRAGLRLPFSCSSGVCGTCKTRKLSGEVEMAHAGGIRPREIAQGFILPCCSKPRGDVVLDR